MSSGSGIAFSEKGAAVDGIVDEAEVAEIAASMERSLKTAQEAGVTEAEVYFVWSKSTSVSFERDVIESSKESLVKGFGVRAVIDGAMGSAGTNLQGRLDDAMKNAVSIARVMDKDPDWKSLPSGDDLPRLIAAEGLFSEELAAMSLEDCIGAAISIIDGVRAVKDCRPTSGGLSRSVSGEIIMNTNGVFASQRKTRISAYTEAAAGGTGDDMAKASEFGLSREADLDPESIGRKAAELACRSMNPGSAPSGKMPVIFSPEAFADILENAFVNAVDADAVQKGRSALIGKTGEAIAETDLSLIDDGRMAGGLSSAAFDDEGVPCQRTEIIGNGVLKSFLYDCRTAGKDNVRSTGNGFRGSYSAAPGVDVTNLVVEFPKSDILAETPRGIYVHSLIGAHTANEISGDFSVECQNSFLIENGEMTKPIRSVMVSGNVFDILKKIDGAGHDVRHTGSVVTPSVRISDLSVIVPNE